MITTTTKTALSFYYAMYFLKYKIYMTKLRRQERERLILNLYNQGKTYREISKEARIFPHDIGVILNKVNEQKKTEESKEEQEQLSLSTQAYKLFSDTKNQLEVAIALNLKEPEVTKFYKEY